MFYFLDKIDNYIRDNGIPFRNVEINSDYLPLYFNYAILCKIRSLGPSVFDLMWPSKYVLTYDDDNNLYLEAIGSDCRTRLFVYSTDGYKNASAVNYRAKISDYQLYKEACVIKYNKKVQDEIMGKLNEKYLNRPVSDKIKELYDVTSIINHEYSYLMWERIASTVDYTKEMDKASDSIIAYIDYLNTAYRDDLLEYDKEKLVTVNFTMPDCDTVVRRSGVNSGNNSRDRINKIIPANDRVNILNSFDYDYYCLASSGSNRKVDYYCYLYRNYDDIPILVIESYSGINYTKVIYLEREYNYSKEEFSYLCKKYLELSNFDSFQTGRVIRFNHTNIEDFDSNIKLVIDGTSRKKDYNKCMRVKKIVNNL